MKLEWFKRKKSNEQRLEENKARKESKISTEDKWKGINDKEPVSRKLYKPPTKPKLVASELNKAKEDKKLPSEQRNKFRQEKKAFIGQDKINKPMSENSGISEVGVEIRRANPHINTFAR